MSILVGAPRVPTNPTSWPRSVRGTTRERSTCVVQRRHDHCAVVVNNRRRCGQLCGEASPGSDGRGGRAVGYCPESTEPVERGWPQAVEGRLPCGPIWGGENRSDGPVEAVSIEPRKAGRTQGGHRADNPPDRCRW